MISNFFHWFEDVTLYFRIQEVEGCKGKHVVKRLLETGSTPTIFNVTFGVTFANSKFNNNQKFKNYALNIVILLFRPKKC